MNTLDREHRLLGVQIPPCGDEAALDTRWLFDSPDLNACYTTPNGSVIVLVDDQGIVLEGGAPARRCIVTVVEATSKPDLTGQDVELLVQCDGAVQVLEQLT